MTRDTPQDPPLTSAPASWSDAPSRDALQLIAEGVTQLAGFGIAAISAVREAATRDNAAIIEALRRRDAPRARELISDYLLRTLMSVSES